MTISYWGVVTKATESHVRYMWLLKKLDYSRALKIIIESKIREGILMFF